MTSTVTEGQRVTVLDPAGRGTVHGKVMFCRPSGCAVDDDRGIRYWTTYDRVTPVSRDTPVPYHHDLFGPLMPEIERGLFDG